MAEELPYESPHYRPIADCRPRLPRSAAAAWRRATSPIAATGIGADKRLGSKAFPKRASDRTEDFRPPKVARHHLPLSQLRLSGSVRPRSLNVIHTPQTIRAKTRRRARRLHFSFRLDRFIARRIRARHHAAAWNFTAAFSPTTDGTWTTPPKAFTCLPLSPRARFIRLERQRDRPPRGARRCRCDSARPPRRGVERRRPHRHADQPPASPSGPSWASPRAT